MRRIILSFSKGLLIATLLSGCKPTIMLPDGNLLTGEEGDGTGDLSTSELPKASSLSWEQSSPTNESSLRARWNPSPAITVMRQLIQAFTDDHCGVAAGPKEELLSGATDSWSLDVSDGNSYTFQVTTEDHYGQSVVSECSSAIRVDQLAPAQASSLALVTPSSSPGNVATPEIRISGVASGDVVELHSDAACSSVKASGTAAGATIDLTSSVLTEGDTIFYARSIDPAGNASDCSTASVTYKVDQTQPGSPGGVACGTLSNSLSSSPVITWGAATDANGIGKYQVGIGTSNASPDVATWSDLGTDLTATINSLTLTTGNSYYCMVRAVDVAGNTSGIGSSSWTVDAVLPSQPGAVTYTPSGNLSGWMNSTSISPVFNWGASTDSSGINRYEVAIGTSAGGTQVADWATNNAATAKQYSGLSLSSGTTYYFSVRAVDNAGNTSSVQQTHWGVDTAAPTTPGSINDGTTLANLSQSPVISWTASSESLSGIDHYEVAIGTTAGGTDTENWASVGNVTSATITGLSLTAGTIYYASVKAIDGAGNTSSVGQGDGWTAEVEQSIPSTWLLTSTTGAPSARALHSAVWTGSQMIVWGGYSPNGWGSIYHNTGGVYDPVTDSWTAPSTSGAPSARKEHTAVWTGSQMIVWGGVDNSATKFDTGGVYDPTTNSWTATSTTGAPAGRIGHTAVWTGSKMIVWGGAAGSSVFNEGGVYDPSTNSWTATSTTGAPAGRFGHTAVWTGSKMIIWGGYGNDVMHDTGGIYDPSTDSWAAISMTGVPEARQDHSAVWAGSQMIVWGGYGSGKLNTGGIYDPSTDSWAVTSMTGVPEVRNLHTALWTGSKMIVFGGVVANNYGTNTGGAYDPTTDSWTATSITGAPQGREDHSALWTGSKMIVWGGRNSSTFYNTGGLLQ